MTTNPNLDHAREWAEHVQSNYFPEQHKAVVAAARVIASLPDEWVDADKLREVIETTPIDPDSLALEPLIEELRALLPSPTPPTLADMTPEERQACVGMWCDNLVSAAKAPTPVVLACVQGEQCWILHTSIHGEPSCFSLENVAPRVDMPRAWNPDGTPPHGEWVDTEKPATGLLEAMWEAADEGANAAFDAGDTDAADRAVMRQEIIAELTDNLKESL